MWPGVLFDGKHSMLFCLTSIAILNLTCWIILHSIRKHEGFVGPRKLGCAVTIKLLYFTVYAMDTGGLWETNLLVLLLKWNWLEFLLQAYDYDSVWSARSSNGPDFAVQISPQYHKPIDISRQGFWITKVINADKEPYRWTFPCRQLLGKDQKYTYMYSIVWAYIC